jgi:integrase
MNTANSHNVIASDPETQRALELDTLAAILPMDRRDRLAELLTDEDVATLTHLARAGMGANTLRALASDLAYLETWAWAVLSGPLPWPAPEALILRFIAHHLWDPVQRETDPLHGMPEAVASVLRANDQLRVEGPHAPATVRRRLAHWSTLHRWRGLAGPFGAPNVRQALRLATRAARRPRGRKSERPVTRDVLDQLLATWPRDREGVQNGHLPVWSVSQMLNLQLAPQPREVIGRHRIAVVAGMVGPVLQMLEPSRDPLASLGAA